MSLITAHVLDAVTGTPAAGVAVVLSGPDAAEIARAITNADGRVPQLGPEALPAGDYLISFATGDWFAAAIGHALH